MKVRNLILSVSAGAMALGMSSCHNADVSFPDSDGGISVYFAYQHPIRTIMLGETETYDNSREANDHSFTIYGIMGGSYSGKKIDVDVQWDESLVQNLTFDDGRPVKVLPSSHYQIDGDMKLHYNGKFRGGIDVKLTEAFFNDPLSVGNNYVIPLVMTNATGQVDRILTGEPSPGVTVVRQDVAKWITPAQDYTLFLVNYINKYDGNYLRRGTDKVTEGGNTKTVERKKEFIENDEVVKVTTKSLNTAVLPVSTLTVGGTPVTCELLLTFDGSDKCTISSNTDGFTVTGSGEFLSKSEKLAWGNKDRDGLHLNYKITSGGTTYETSDILVARDRGSAASIREFSTIYND